MRQLKLAVSLGSPPPRSARWLLGWLAAFGAKERLPRPPGAWDLEPQFWGTAKVLILILMASVHRDLVWNLCLGPLGWVEHPSTKWRSLWWTWWKSLWLWSPSVCLCWAGLGKVEASRPSPVAQEAPLLPSQSHRGMEVLLHPRGGPNKRLYMISTPPRYCKHSCPPPAASLWPDKLGPHSAVWCSCTKPRRKTRSFTAKLPLQAFGNPSTGLEQFIAILGHFALSMVNKVTPSSMCHLRRISPVLSHLSADGFKHSLSKSMTSFSGSSDSRRIPNPSQVIRPMSRVQLVSL